MGSHSRMWIGQSKVLYKRLCIHSYIPSSNRHDCRDRRSATKSLPSRQKLDTAHNKIRTRCCICCFSFSDKTKRTLHAFSLRIHNMGNSNSTDGDEELDPSIEEKLKSKLKKVTFFSCTWRNFSVGDNAQDWTWNRLLDLRSCIVAASTHSSSFCTRICTLSRVSVCTHTSVTRISLTHSSNLLATLHFSCTYFTLSPFFVHTFDSPAVWRAPHTSFYATTALACSVHYCVYGWKGATSYTGGSKRE